MSRILATLPGRVRVTYQGTDTALEVVFEDYRASLWLEAILDQESVSWLDILLHVLPAEQGDELADMLVSGDLTMQTLVSASRDMLSTVAARPWWEALNIIAVANASWETIGGEMASRGLQADVVTLGTWLDAAFFLIRRASRDEQAHDQLVTEIKRKPIEETDDGEMDVEDFEATMTELAGH